MQQFKPYFLGVETPPAPRLTTAQRCFRTTDIENVGKTARHLTFFEMLGNFTFGDYFKEEVDRLGAGSSRDELGIDPERDLGRRVFGGDDDWCPADDEADRALGEPRRPRRADRPARAQDNFWPAGPTGPCGPCSELYFDWGPRSAAAGPDCAPGCDCDRFLEFWNLVFMPVRPGRGRRAHAAAARRTSTPAWASSASPPSTQGVATVFETDLFAPLIAPRRGALRRRLRRVGRGRPRAADHRRPRPRRRLPGHRRRRCPATRAATTSCGASCAARCSRASASASTSPSWRVLADAVVDLMGEAYPELVAAARRDRARRRRRGGALPAHARAGHGHPRRGPAPSAQTPAPSCPPRSPSSSTTPTASPST